MHYSQIYFWNKTLRVSDSSSVQHQEFFTVHTAMVYVIQVFWQLAGRIRTEVCPDPARKLSANLYDIYHCSGVPRNFVRGGFQQIHLRTEDRENGDLGAVAP